MHASLSRFLSMKGAGNVATSTAKSIPLAATLPTPFLMPWAPHGCVSCCSARSGQTKQECDTKAQNLDLRCCGWIFTKNKITGRNSPFFSFIIFPLLLLLYIQVMLRKASFCWTFYTFSPLPTLHCNMAVYPIEICVSWHSYRVEHN